MMPTAVPRLVNTRRPMVAWRRLSASAPPPASPDPPHGMGRTAFLQNRFRQPLGLVHRRGGHEQDELVAADAFEGLDPLLRFLRRLHRASPDARPVLAVVAGQVLLRLFGDLVADGEIS